MTEGRSCPLAYRYDPASLCAEPQQVAGDVLYVPENWVHGVWNDPESDGKMVVAVSALLTLAPHGREL